MSPSKASAKAAARREAAAKAVAAARAAERRQRRLLTLAGVGVVLIAAIVIGLIVSNQSDDSGPVSDPTKVVAGFPDSVRQDDGVVMSKPGASVTVEMYVDLQCPACKAYEERVAPTLEKLVADGTVKLVVHPIAILNRMSSTEYSSRAASAVASAADEGKFWQYAKVLYAEQPPEGGDGLTADKLVELGKKVGLDSPEFAQSVKSEQYSDWVDQITQTAKDKGISATPTVLVNGDQITDSTADGLKTAVEKAAKG